MTNEELQNYLTKAIIESMPDDLKALMDQGWVYKDMPGKIPAKVFDEFIKIFSKDDIKILSFSHGVGGNGYWKRCQMLISPIGMKKLEEYLKNKVDNIK